MRFVAPFDNDVPKLVDSFASDSGSGDVVARKGAIIGESIGTETLEP